jgi:hypothetical protein
MPSKAEGIGQEFKAASSVAEAMRIENLKLIWSEDLLLFCVRTNETKTLLKYKILKKVQT